MPTIKKNQTTIDPLINFLNITRSVPYESFVNNNPKPHDNMIWTLLSILPSLVIVLQILMILNSFKQTKLLQVRYIFTIMYQKIVVSIFTIVFSTVLTDAGNRDILIFEIPMLSQWFLFVYLQSFLLVGYKTGKYIDEKDHNATIKLFFIVLALYLVMLSRVELGYISSGLNVSNKIRTTQLKQNPVFITIICCIIPYLSHLTFRKILTSKISSLTLENFINVTDKTLDQIQKRLSNMSLTKREQIS